VEGDAISEGGVGAEPDDEPWNNLWMSIFIGFEGACVAELAGIVVPFGGGGFLETDEMDGLPLT
jgi:hypothetical protein